MYPISFLPVLTNAKKRIYVPYILFLRFVICRRLQYFTTVGLDYGFMIIIYRNDGILQFSDSDR